MPSDENRVSVTLLKEQETKLDILRNTLIVGEEQLDQGLGVDGQTFMQELMVS